MADKAKGKPGAPPPPDKPEEKDAKAKKVKSPQPKDEVGTRKKCRRYRWELKKSNREFWIMGHGEVKFLGLGCLIGALILFSGLSVHPLLILIVSMELAILIFFFVVYTFAINRYMPFILWPVSDLLNDLIAVCFLVGAVIFALKSHPAMHMHYFVALAFTGLAALFSLIDVCLQRKHFKGKKVKKNVLVPPPGKDQVKSKDATKAPDAEANKDKPPADKPPADKPPADKPPADKPKTPGDKEKK
ncbi:PREDICTED: CKLF-like MARVEL transmembrane domain-containing protein 2-like [Chrysochloris asiatica]|uniref:CKLF-like MARVEL transmembrane domain-containing protein 2-like n=1 Tax=Chrysochloris asiatica TaxID=185453 RepID=A0A9B0TJI2_CHRAS|nr:PREDICTED: CKLF-like MARVEL transmembrane domain-containing protein 2-like [Chrysochloris asiatica]